MQLAAQRVSPSLQARQDSPNQVRRHAEDPGERSSFWPAPRDDRHRDRRAGRAEAQGSPPRTAHCRDTQTCDSHERRPGYEPANQLVRHQHEAEATVTERIEEMSLVEERLEAAGHRSDLATVLPLQ